MTARHTWNFLKMAIKQTYFGSLGVANSGPDGNMMLQLQMDSIFGLLDQSNNFELNLNMHGHEPCSKIVSLDQDKAQMVNKLYNLVPVLTSKSTMNMILIP